MSRKPLRKKETTPKKSRVPFTVIYLGVYAVTLWSRLPDFICRPTLNFACYCLDTVKEVF
jgi:hypothetical protein